MSMMSAGDDEWRTSEAEMILGSGLQKAYSTHGVGRLLHCRRRALWLFVRGNLLDKLSVVHCVLLCSSPSTKPWPQSNDNN